MHDQFIPTVPLNRQSDKPRTGRVFACEACGSSFYRHAAEIRKGERRGSRMRYCSRECATGVKSATNVERACPRCGKTFSAWASRIKKSERLEQRLFCSAACRDAERADERRNAVEVSCTTCGSLMMRTPAHIFEHMFCSEECHAAGVVRWLSGNGWGKYGKREDIGHFVRSAWEANVARVLIALGIPYEYEPRAFKLSCGTYVPDFYAVGLWIEVKGRMTGQAAAKIAAFRVAHPNERLLVIAKPEYRVIEDAFALTIPNWESPWTNWGKHKHAIRFVSD